MISSVPTYLYHAPLLCVLNLYCGEYLLTLLFAALKIWSALLLRFVCCLVGGCSARVESITERFRVSWRNIRTTKRVVIDISLLKEYTSDVGSVSDVSNTFFFSSAIPPNTTILRTQSKLANNYVFFLFYLLGSGAHVNGDCFLRFVVSVLCLVANACKFIFRQRVVRG